MTSETVYKPTQPIKKLAEGGNIEQPKYMPSYYEWLFKQGQQINLYNSVNAGTLTLIYTVPEGYSFFISSVNLAVTRAGEAFGYNEIYIDASAAGGRLIKMYCSLNSTQNIINSFNPAIKFNAGQMLYLNVSNATNSIIWGFLVKNSLIPNI